MKRILIMLSLVAAAIVGVALLQGSPAVGVFLWSVSGHGAWLLPLVLVSAILDSVHPCSFSILLVTVALLFGLQMDRPRILRIGGAYIAGIFASYLLIGLGVLGTLSIFGIPHFMGRLGAAILITFGALNLLNYFFPKFPIRLRIPSVSHTAMGRLMEKASIPAAFALGVLVGVCQFPCMGGPYLMVIGLLHDQMTYFAGFGYLVLYNFILALPLAAVLFIAADKTVVEKAQEWKRTNLSGVRLWAGIVMLILGAAVLFL